jgi:hypothetical protein
MGALYLQPLDERMERLGVFYARRDHLCAGGLRKRVLS